jgi:hypothetical protein
MAFGLCCVKWQDDNLVWQGCGNKGLLPNLKPFYRHLLLGYGLHNKGILGKALCLHQTILILSISLVVKWLVCEADGLFLSSAKVKEACSCISISPYIFME